MWPFGVRLQDLSMYRFHETRIAGFGPFFSGVWLISLLLTGWLLWRPGLRILLIIGYVTLTASLLVSIHLWWARYGPQLWWLPMIPILAAFYLSRSRAQVVVAWGLVGILTVNALIVAAVRMHWEVHATRTLNRQLTAIQASGSPIDIDFQYFGEPVGERLKTWGISFNPVREDEIRDGRELISVVNGYPGGIHYRIVQASTPSQE